MDIPTPKKPRILDTPVKLLVTSPDRKNAVSRGSSVSTTMGLRAPSLQPPAMHQVSRGRSQYSQSPPRSPNRSPGRAVELIQLSPIKNSRLELQRLYDTKQKKVERLCIRTLVLENFKSYAGRQVVGPFHSSFSAVVGPNGSGKSNVIDSMLFAFGFRANKMRQGKLSHLIHKSEKYPDLDFCSVEIQFQYVVDEPDGSTRVLSGKPELTVMRKAFKNNTSKYYLNGKESTYTEVTRLLRDEGIDLDHKRFLILQGEVESIAQMKPKAEHEGDDGLLEYLEDIIGTTKYKAQIEQALVEVASLNDICMEKENRFDLVEKEKLSLEPGKDEALEFLNKEKDLTLLMSKKYQYHLYHNGSKLAKTLSSISDTMSRLEREKARKAEAQKEIVELTKASEELANRLVTMNNKNKESLAKMRQLERELVSNEEKQKSLLHKRSKAEKTLNAVEKGIKQCENKIEEYAGQNQEYETSLATLNSTIVDAQSELEKMKLALSDKTGHITKEVAVLEKELEPWTTKVEEKKSEIKLVESEISIIKEAKVKLESEITNLSEELEQLRSKISQREQSIEILNDESSRIRDYIVVGERECKSARAKLEEMKKVLVTHRQRVNDARSAVSSAENKNNVLTALSRLQKSGRIDGFHGRLGDLGMIDDRYDIAISTACPRLDDIVVETVECGQQCIEHLRKNKLGYARFILLDKLRKFNLQPVNTPENVPRLFDLVKPKEQKFAPAFYSVLRDTLVTTDLSQANRVAYGKKRYRVVTLDGKLIDISGTMTGGGDRAASGLMKSKQQTSLYTPEEVQRMETELNEREKNFKVAFETFQEMESALQKYLDRQPEIEVEHSKQKMDIETISAELESKIERKLELERSSKASIEDNSELRTAEEKLATLNADLNSFMSASESKNQRIKELRGQIMEIGGLELQTLNSKVDSLNQQIKIVVAKQKKDKTAMKKAELELKRARKQQVTAKDDIEQCDTEIQKMKSNYDIINTGIHELQELLSDLQEQIGTLTDEHAVTKHELDQKNEKIDSYNSIETELTDQLEKLQNLANYLKKEMNEYDSKLGHLKLRDLGQLMLDLDENTSSQTFSRSPTPDTKQENIQSSILETHLASPSPNERKGSIVENNQSMEIDEHASVLENGLPKLADAELSKVDLEDLERDIVQLQDYIDNSHVDIEILDEYAKRLAEYRRRRIDLNDAVMKRDETRMHCEVLKKRRLDEFMKGFGIISITLKEMYQMITMGGNAELELVDSLDPFSEGVLFSVMPPKKSWRNISNLSGGEKTLSSLALVFALHKYKPTPLYVMDEIDAALDFRNVSIVANYIKERTKNAQFIVISLRNNMFELAQRLVGIYKNSNMTRSTTLQNRDIINVL
ncbi:AaceriAGR089Cp [[Ashbya] aceris (nom. inval.)]|nr:AaceriAGR089Cp [[Ashbya] aceris (nom. inval.)]